MTDRCQRNREHLTSPTHMGGLLKIPAGPCESNYWSKTDESLGTDGPMMVADGIPMEFPFDLSCNPFCIALGPPVQMVEAIDPLVEWH